MCSGWSRSTSKNEEARIKFRYEIKRISNREYEANLEGCKCRKEINVKKDSVRQGQLDVSKMA